MNPQLTDLLQNYKDGVPVKIERSSVLLMAVATIVTVAVSALIVKYVRKM